MPPPPLLPFFSGRTVSASETDGLARALNRRFGLPRIARWCAPWQLEDARAIEFVEVVGTYAPGHFESSDFDGLKLRGDALDRGALVAGRRYRVTAMFSPGF